MVKIRRRYTSTTVDFYNFFSMSAKKAVYRASEICGQFNNQYLEPEHVFYSILNLRSCSAVQVLHQLEVKLPKLTYSLEAFLYEHAGTFKGNPVFSHRTISLLDSAYKEVKRLHHREIGTTHLLVALAQDQNSFLKDIFHEHNLDAKRIRDTYMLHLKGHSQGKPPQRKPDPYLYAQEPDPAEPSAHKLSELVTVNVAPVTYSQAATLLLATAMLTAQTLGDAELRPLHLIYAATISPGLRRLFEPGQQGTAAVKKVGGPHLLNMEPIKELERRVYETVYEEPAEGERARMGKAVSEVLGNAYKLSLNANSTQITINHVLIALLMLDDVEVQSMLARGQESVATLLSFFENNNKRHPKTDWG